MFVALVSVAVGLFLKELPLRRTHELEGDSFRFHMIIAQRV